MNSITDSDIRSIIKSDVDSITHSDINSNTNSNIAAPGPSSKVLSLISSLATSWWLRLGGAKVEKVPRGPSQGACTLPDPAWPYVPKP